MYIRFHLTQKYIVSGSDSCLLQTSLCTVQAKTIPNGSLGIMFSRLHRRVTFPCGSEEGLEREEKQNPRSEIVHGNRFLVSPSYVTSVGTRACRHFPSTVSVDTDTVSVDAVLPLPLQVLSYHGVCRRSCAPASGDTALPCLQTHTCRILCF